MTNWPDAGLVNASKAQKCRELARAAKRPEVAEALLELALEIEADAAAWLRREHGPEAAD